LLGVGWGENTRGLWHYPRWVHQSSSFPVSVVLEDWVKSVHSGRCLPRRRVLIACLLQSRSLVLGRSQSKLLHARAEGLALGAVHPCSNGRKQECLRSFRETVQTGMGLAGLPFRASALALSYSYAKPNPLPTYPIARKRSPTPLPNFGMT
jgi:hypothetical protein